jgi:hypothetical protein
MHTREGKTTVTQSLASWAIEPNVMPIPSTPMTSALNAGSQRLAIEKAGTRPRRRLLLMKRSPTAVNTEASPILNEVTRINPLLIVVR